MKIPQTIIDQSKNLNALLEKDNLPYIKVQDVADFIGMDVDCLRAAAEHGSCSFAIGGRHGMKGNRFVKIPKLAFYNFMTQGAAFKDKR